MARAFDNGSSQYLEVDSVPTTAVPLSIACWFNSDDDANTQCLCALLDASSSNLNYFALQLQGGVAGDPISALTSDGAATSSATTTSGYTAGTWHHTLGVWAAVDSRSAYIDGGGKHTSTASRTPTGIDRLSIGARRDTGPGQYMSGNIAELAVWLAALTDAEALILAEGYSPLFIRPASLAFYLPLVRDEDEDIVGGLSLTAGRAPTIAAHPRIIYPAPQALAHIAAATGISIPVLYHHYKMLRTA